MQFLSQQKNRKQKSTWESKSKPKVKSLRWGALWQHRAVRRAPALRQTSAPASVKCRRNRKGRRSVRRLYRGSWRWNDAVVTSRERSSERKEKKIGGLVEFAVRCQFSFSKQFWASNCATFQFLSVEREREEKRYLNYQREKIEIWWEIRRWSPKTSRIIFLNGKE